MNPLLAPITGYLIVVASVLLAEKFSIGSHVYQLLLASEQHTLLSNTLLDFGKGTSRTLILAPVIFAVLIHSSLGRYLNLAKNVHLLNRSSFLVAQVAAFAAFYAITGPAFSASQLQIYYQVIWLALGLAVVVLTALSLAAFSFWEAVLLEQKWALLAALAFSSGAWWLGGLTQTLWTDLSDVTFMWVSMLLELMVESVHYDFERKIIGINDFSVFIDTQCSGYEGIGLVTAFVFIFLYAFRHDFRFPQALLLFPIGAITIWLFNIVRIAALILIGGFWSPDVAVWGFHTQAGWIAFILTSTAIIWLAHGIRFFSATAGKTKDKGMPKLNLAIACLLPAIALLASTFFTEVFSARFDWLYPLRVLAVGGVLIYCFRYLDLTPIRWHTGSLVAGAVVAVLWVLMITPDTETDSLIASTLTESDSRVASFWLLFRVIGAVITVPIAEELAFRAYLLCRFSSQEVVTRGSVPFALSGFITSSLAFGFLHDAWLAGTVAGMIYALVRYRTQHIADPIIAHGFTNLLIFIFAAWTGHWSLM